MLRTLLIVPGLAAFSLLSGCSGPSRAHLAELTIPEGAQVLAVDVRNLRGSVEVRVNPRVRSATIESSVGVATRDDTSPNRDQDIIDAMDVSAGVDHADGRAVLRVSSTSRRPDAEDQRIDLKITVPRCDGIHIENRGGLVMTVGTAGAHTITNRSGPIEVRTDKPIVDPVTLTTTDGNIYYQVPTGSTGTFDLATLSGECAFRDEVSEEKDVYYTRNELSTVLAHGDNPVVARTNKGDVRVWVIKDPVGLTRVYKKTIPDFRDLLFLDGSQRFMRNLPDDAPRNTEYARWYNLR